MEEKRRKVTCVEPTNVVDFEFNSVSTWSSYSPLPMTVGPPAEGLSVTPTPFFGSFPGKIYKTYFQKIHFIRPIGEIFAEHKGMPSQKCFLVNK